MTTKKTADRLPVHSFQSLLADLGTICANRIAPTDADLGGFTLVTTPTPVQHRAFAEDLNSQVIGVRATTAGGTSA